ncbi:hypothetical protein Halru_2388 [Halovivax ruber XH-70]|uniref:Uncharacterized protein n=1 Tax=Halovivax ruber (strain DSM 18193 / JCM 13892 / XH-70) TaxID=797302 RepID=L0IG66_HALRX|nr:hypothetical protein Halru_2388 [Halovivax ruber XH-70]
MTDAFVPASALYDVETRSTFVHPAKQASEIESPKTSGDAIEADVIQAVDALGYVGDATVTWHDAETTGLLKPSTALPFYGIVVVMPETPIEIEACQVRTSNGSRSTRGRFYVKRRTRVAAQRSRDQIRGRRQSRRTGRQSATHRVRNDSGPRTRLHGNARRS